MSIVPLRSAAAFALMLALAAPTLARQTGPVFPDDSLAGREALSRVAELAESGNLGEAVRVLQQVLDREGDRVLEAAGQTDLFIPLRARAHELLLSTPALLERYRATEGPRADTLLTSATGVDSVERSRLLTRAGLEAALRLAQDHLEAARFEAARLVLQQLEHHPDRAGASPTAKDCARMAEQTARRLQRPELTAWAARWLTEAGLEPAPAEPPAPHHASPPALTPFSTTSAFEADQIVGRPLATAWISPDVALAADNARRRRRRPPDESLEQPWVMPACVGDVLYINDASAVSAWDRLTLTPIWRTRPPEPGADADEDPGDTTRTVLDTGNTRVLEDSCHIAIGGGVVVAATGWVRDGERRGDPRIHAYDALTGRLLWSIPLAAIDPALSEGGARGAILIDHDTAVITIRRLAGNRRVTSAHLAGIDLYTGRPKWTRLLATAGSLPYQRMSRVTDTPILHEGVVFRCDDVGIIAAVEAATGRPVWVRRFPSLNAPGPDASSAPWAASSAIVAGPSLITLTPSHDAVVRLDSATGALVGQRAAGELDDPRYLLAVGPWLVCVGNTHLTFVDLADFEHAAPRRSPELVDPNMDGRAVIADNVVLVPLGPGSASGLAIVNPEQPDLVRRIPLETSGNLLALGAEVLIVDDARLHSYVGWERADRVLTQRLAADPADAKPALSLVDLAFRAGKPDRIAAAADVALDRLAKPTARPADADENRRLQRQLYHSLLAMIESAQSPAPAPADHARTGGAPDQAIRDPHLLDALTDRLGRAAESPDEQVTYLLTLGRLREMQTNAPGAVEAYQRVLARPELAGATWTGTQVAVRGDLEASRRIRDVVGRFGRPAYRAFDTEAQRESQAAPDNPEALAALARMYPAAAIGPRLWIRAAEIHDRAGQPTAAARDYTAGLRAAEWGAQLGDPERIQEIGEIAGRLVHALETQDRLSAAAQLIDRIQRTYPAVQITRDGVPIASDSLAAAIAQRLAGLERPARIGAVIGREPQRLDGWELLEPLTHDRARPVDHVLMVSPTTNRIGLWTAAAEPGRLQLAWTRESAGAQPVLIRLDSQAAYLFWHGEKSGTVERIQVVGGKSEWTTPPIRTLLGETRNPATDGLPATLPTFLDGDVQPHDLVVAADEQTLVLVERGGGAAAIDLATGRSLWSRAGTLGLVFDVDINAGLVALAGLADRRAALDNSPPSPRIALLDARSGEPVRAVTPLTGQPRWLRLTPQGLLVAGLDDRVLAWDAASGALNWTMTDTGARRCVDAWIFGDRLFLLDADRQLWLASLTSGRTVAGPLKTRERLGERLAITGSLSGPNTLFSTERGFLVYNPAGELIGADGVDARTQLIPARAAESLLVSMDTKRAELPDGRSVARLLLFASDNGKLTKGEDVVLAEDPSDVALLDGAIIITAGSGSVVLAAPATEK